MKQLLFILIINFALPAGAQKPLSGIIVDDETGEPLPFATVAFKDLHQGTVSNKNGDFRLTIDGDLAGTPILVSYLGYRSKEIPYADVGRNMVIRLEAHVLTLDELVIRPLSPTEYIKRALKRMDENYPASPFTTHSYYREKFIEDGKFINLVEGYFKSYYPEYQDTIPNQHQLLLFRQIDDPADIRFMSAWVDKRQKKEKRKAERKGKEYEDINPSEEIRNGFGGPENILTMDLMKGGEPCLDSTLFKKFKYRFADGVRYLNRELLVIDFESKGTVEHTRQQGKIYLDTSSDAIVALEYSGEVRIPAFVKPILFAFGLSIGKPKFVKKIRYQLANGKWYPENFEWYVDVTLKKSHLFRTNEESNFVAEQLLKVNRIHFDDLSEIDREKRFDAEKDMAEQQFNDENITWNNVLTLLPEVSR